MQVQSDAISKNNWRKGKQPFEGGRQKFIAIPKQKRSNYNKKMIETKQDINPPAIIFHKQYPSSGKFQYDGYSVHYSYIENTISPKAILVHFHGLNGHGGSSGYFSSVIAEKNKELNIYVMDQLNFGQSEGPFRGEIRSFQDSIKQGEQFVNFITSKFKQKPKIFLSGSSFGATIIFKMIINKPQTYAGALLITPALRNLAEYQPYLKKMAKFLGWIMPKTLFIPQTIGGSTKYKSQQIIKNDPYFYNGKVVLGSIRTLLNSVDEISVFYNLFNIPYITFQAGVDKSVDSFAGLDLEELSPSKDKTTIFCQNMWHAAFLEEEIQGISWKCAQWLRERI